MNGPCDSCPFRTDVRAYLRRDRAREIADALRSDGAFHCHKTVDYNQESPRVTNRSRLCRGALVVMHREGALFDNVMHRLGALCGDFDPANLELDAPVPNSLAEWVSNHGVEPAS